MDFTAFVLVGLCVAMVLAMLVVFACIVASGSYSPEERKRLDDEEFDQLNS